MHSTLLLHYHHHHHLHHRDDVLSAHPLYHPPSSSGYGHGYGPKKKRNPPHSLAYSSRVNEGGLGARPPPPPPLPPPSSSSSSSSSSFSSSFCFGGFPQTKVKTGHRRGRSWVARVAEECLYDVLGVPPTASERDIKQAYRRLALRYHPDVNKEADAKDKFIRIKQAYQTLVDDKSRSRYDSTRRSGFAWDDFSRGSSKSRKASEEEKFYGLDDFFRDLQADFEKRQAEAETSGKTKSLWEELAEIGEEFVEFLEKELNVSDPNDKGKSEGGGFNDFGFTGGEASNLGSDIGKKAADEAKRKAKNDIEEIEVVLAQLKKELGLQ